ncbi:MAG: DUF4382 domain-containing protein [Proteobacteria bacterium]|nr:DUF4382 domain-containing protein [Pseudomonadota bacterium]MBU4055872.1 DUF4382 domain-containing protein [Pseudomonadota bacterium]
MKVFISRFRSLFLVLLAILFAATGITGCSSGGGSSDLAKTDSGEIAISLTDAMGDFGSYTVDILSVDLTMANGTQVSTLPITTRIDFAQYTEMTEFLTAAQVPFGSYTAASLTLDYQNADIQVEDENGQYFKITEIQDASGNPVTTLTITVNLENRNHLTIAPGILSHLALDFDLKASNHIDFSDPANPVLTVDPFLVADVDRTNGNKIHKVRGLLEEVDVDAGTFSVILRPFSCALSDNHTQYGIRSVLTDSETVFNINQESFQGEEGLQALAELDALTPVVALGDLEYDPLVFLAREVYAGSSVPGASLDAVNGYVVKRSGDVLTIKGASLRRKGTDRVFHEAITVQISESTIVTREFSADAWNKDDVSIGQHVMVMGTFSLTDESSLELDATEGYLKMLMTCVRGSVISKDTTNPVSQLVMNLQTISHFRTSEFDFSGTGIDEANDADPTNYEIFTGNMDLSTILPGTPVILKGFMEPFGAAPPDFSAHILMDVCDIESFLKINWNPPTAEPFETISSTGLVLNPDGVGNVHHLVRWAVATDLLDLSIPPVLSPDDTGEGAFSIRQNKTVERFTIFEDFTARLEELLDGGEKVRQIHSVGLFNDQTSVLTASLIQVDLQ